MAGAPARYLVDGFVQDRTRGDLPWGTFVVNVTGSLLLGVVTGLALGGHLGDLGKDMAGTGFCGAFTTCSTFTFELTRLAEEGRWAEAGRIDHANHNSDPGGMIWDWMAADETLRLVKDFADRDGETLVIFAPDHDTGGSVVYGYGPWYQNSNAAFDTLGQRPGPMAATLHGLFFGRIAPPARLRRLIEAPALVIGHSNDPVHAHADAEMLAIPCPERFGVACAEKQPADSLNPHSPSP